MDNHNNNLINAMTIDVEDYFHVSAFAQHVAPRDWDQMPSRVVNNTHCLLRLLDKHQVRSTCFVLGWVAQKHPSLVRDIQKAGHEIGCHSYWHRLVYEMTPDEFRDDLRLSRDVLQEITGEKCTLYRAPSFSVVQSSRWALDILASEGFRIDSSIYPIYHDRYGYPAADPFVHRIDTPSGRLLEYPGNALRIAGLRLPISGGGYFRLYPRQVTQLCLRRWLNRTHRPFMFYIHPWEVDPDQPRLPGSWRSKFRHYQNLVSTERKLDYLLPQFRFGTISESVAGCLADCREYSLNSGLYEPGVLAAAMG